MANDSWQTPLNVFKEWDDIFHFALDAAADQSNHLCPRWYGQGGEVEDALTVEWPTDINIWCNPPYSRGMQRKFTEKALNCAERGGTVVMLLPADTSTKLFHDLNNHPWCLVKFRKGRVTFLGATGPAKFGSMFVRFQRGDL